MHKDPVNQPVVVVSIDGVAPRFITPDVMPTVCALASEGASCFTARTVIPSITLPAHASLLRGIDPDVHGIVDNTPQPLSDAWPTFLRAARSHGLRTAAAVNWAPVAGLLEPDAVDARYFLDGGYDPDDDRLIRVAASSLFAAHHPHVLFVYFVAPDLAGHDHGWGSPQYLDALRASDAHLADLAETIGDAALLVTTDHGGHGTDHQLSEPIDQITFVTLRSNDVKPATSWAQASILDVAPTVAELAGFAVPNSWSGASLVGKERPTVDVLLDEVRSLEQHSYGEDLSMLSHALQTAAHAADAAGQGGDQLALAGLLHDVGHLSDNAGVWGDPDHADLGAVRLQQLLPASIVEPIRLHVTAKQWLVSADPGYLDELSTASQETLRQQGGPLDQAASAGFLATPWAEHAIALRKCDDAAKEPVAEAPPAETYRDALAGALVQPPTFPASVRNQCYCEQCRDATSGQSLLDVDDLADWRVVNAGATATQLRHTPTGETHNMAAGGAPPASLPVEHWGATAPARFARRHAPTATAAIAADVAAFGIALVAGAGVEPGTVLTFARTLGHVRTTNYGELFDVLNKPAATNLAYTAKQLPLHTDNPYRDPVPTVQVLHCLTSAAPDGASLFSDGFRAAAQLREQYPVAFTTLTSTLLTFRYRDDHVDLVAKHPMIELGVDGNVRAVHVNHRSMVPLAATAASERFYGAYERFHALLTSQDQVYTTVLSPGDIAIFDNRRVLHARGAFDVATPRHLQGCYIDIDAVHSVVRRAATR